MAKKRKQSQKPQFRLSCMFCAQDASSREHYFPQWMHGYFGHLKQRIRPLKYSTAIARGRPEIETKYAERQTGRSRVHDPIRRVCGTCNNGWMSDIVKRSAPNLERWALPSGQERSGFIDQAAQVSMATWATLAAITYVSDQNADHVLQFDREFIRRNGTPPPYWTVAIARIETEDAHALIHHGAQMGRFDGNIATMSGPWIFITLIDVVFAIGRQWRGQEHFLNRMTIEKPHIIYPFQKDLLWNELPTYRGDLEAILSQQNSAIGSDSIGKMMQLWHAEGDSIPPAIFVTTKIE